MTSVYRYPFVWTRLVEPGGRSTGKVLVFNYTECNTLNTLNTLPPPSCCVDLFCVMRLPRISADRSPSIGLSVLVGRVPGIHSPLAGELPGGKACRHHSRLGSSATQCRVEGENSLCRLGCVLISISMLSLSLSRSLLQSVICMRVVASNSELAHSLLLVPGRVSIPLYCPKRASLGS